MSVTRVAQDITSGNGSTFDHSKASAALNVPAGALIVVKFSSPQSGNITTAPTDTAGNTYTLAQSQGASNEQCIWYCLNATANAANVVTAAFSNGCSEYGYSVEVYTGGAWTYDSTNSDVVPGAFTTSPTVSPSLSTSGAGVLATCFGQYDWPRAGNSATQTPGSIVNSGGDGTTVVMASGEVINASAFSGTISVNIQQPTPANTKCDLTYASFLSSGGGGSTGTLNAVLGAAVIAAAAAIGIAGASSTTLGNATISAAAAVQTHGALAQTLAPATLAGSGSAPAQGSLGATLDPATLSAAGTVTSGIVGNLDVTLGATQAAAAGNVPVAGSLGATLENAGLSAAASAKVSGTLVQTLAPAVLVASGTSSSGVHGALNVTLGDAALAAAGSIHVAGLGAITLANATTVSAGTVALVGQLNNTLGAATLTATGRNGASYPPDARYYAALGLRPFYGALGLRPFYVSANARNFYVMANPNVTPVLDTKDPRESVVVTLDGSNDLATGETLTSVSKTDVSVISGNDAAQSLVVGTPAINSASVTFTLQNGQTVTMQAGKGVQAEVSVGLTNCQYLIAVTCNTSNPDKVLTLKGILPVSAS